MTKKSDVISSPMTHIFAIDNFLTESEADAIYNRVLEKEPEWIALGKHDYGGVKGDKLTGLFKYYNGLDDELIGSILKPKFLTMYGRQRWVQCWFNTFREGDCITKHIHNDPSKPHHARPRTFTCANLFLGGDEATGTIYDGVNYPNEKGRLLIFGDTIPHWSLPYTGKDVRITMACDIHDHRLNSMMRKLN